MTQLQVVAEDSLTDVVASVGLADLTNDGKDNIVVATMNGEVILLACESGPELVEVARVSEFPPVSAMDTGDVIGSGSNQIVVGCQDNALRILGYKDGAITTHGELPLGTLPTAVCVVNVSGSPAAEVIVATDDHALRCYSWFDIALDKLAHKVVDRPVFSMQALYADSIPYGRVVFGDDSEHVYVFQYADDRLHEVARAKVKGEVQHVATGRLSGGHTDDVLVVSDGRNLSYWRFRHSELERLDSVRAPSAITSLAVGPFVAGSGPEMQILASHDNSLLALLASVSNRIVELTSIKTAKKSVESLVATGDITGTGVTHIVQAVGRNIYLLETSG